MHRWLWRVLAPLTLLAVLAAGCSQDDVDKVVAGTGTPAPGTTFTVEVDCDDDAYDETLTFDATGALTSGTASQSGIPEGTQCTVTETSTGGADGVAYSPNGGTPADAPTVSSAPKNGKCNQASTLLSVNPKMLPSV